MPDGAKLADRSVIPIATQVHQRPRKIARNQQPGRLDRAFFTPGGQPCFERGQQPIGQMQIRIGGKDSCHRRWHMRVLEQISRANTVDVFRNVVQAQRIEQLADQGGVCITAAIHEGLSNNLPFDLENLG